MAQFMSVVDTSQLASIQALWNQLDSNGKGLISASDLKEVMSSVNVDASLDEVNEMIKDLDSDGDGKISFKDFYKAAMKKQGNETSSPLPPRSSSPSITSSPTKNSSSSSSSPATSKYYPSHNQFIQPSKSPAVSPKLEKKEEKKEQKKEENTKERPPRTGSPKFIRSPSVVQFVKQLTGPQMSEMQTLFNHYDHDKDGRINRSSVATIVKEINPSISASDIQELLGTIDADHDNQVNFKEFIDGIVMVYRTNSKKAPEKVVPEIHNGQTESPIVSQKMALKKTIAKLQDEITSKDSTIEELRKQISELQRENARLKGQK